MIRCAGAPAAADPLGTADPRRRDQIHVRVCDWEVDMLRIMWVVLFYCVGSGTRFSLRRSSDPLIFGCGAGASGY